MLIPRVMQMGIGTYTYGWAVGSADPHLATPLNETGLIERALSFGVGLIQIGDNLPLHNFSPHRLSSLKQALEFHRLGVEVGAKKLTEQQLTAYIRICHFLGARLLRFVIDDEEYEPSLTQVEKLISQFVPLLEEHGITLAIENHDRFKAKQLGAIIGSFHSSHVGVCLDSVNSLGAAEGLETVIRYLAPHTVNLHIKDFGILRLPHKQGFIVEGRIAGTGMLDIPGLISVLKQYGRCSSCILEQWVPPEQDMHQTVIKEEQWAILSMEYLRGIGLMGSLKV